MFRSTLERGMAGGLDAKTVELPPSSGGVSTATVLTGEDHVIIVAYHLPLQISRMPDGGYDIEWDDERGIDRTGMGLPMKCTYIGCVQLEVEDLAEQELALHTQWCKSVIRGGQEQS